jgi:hypothetical protein
MTRNVPLSFLEIEVKVDEIKKYVGKPIIFHYLENEQSILSSGMLEDVNENQIYLENVSVLLDDDGIHESWYDHAMIEGGYWQLYGIDFTKDDDPEDPIILNNIQFMYVSKKESTLEQMQNVFVNPDEPMTSLEKIMCIYCWETFPEKKLKQHQKICDDFIQTCPKCHDGIGGTKKEFDEHLTWCAERFYTSTDVKDEQKNHNKIIEKYGSLENYYKKQENETKSYQESIKKQADAWKRIKDKRR